MFETLGVVEVPHQTAGERLSLPSPSRRFGDRSLLEWVLRRVTESQLLDQVVLLVPATTDGKRLAALAPADVSVHLSALRDPLSRFVETLGVYPTKSAVRIAPNAPFIDPVLIDRLITTVNAAPACDYGGYCSGSGRPLCQSHLGTLAEWCSATALRRADREADEKERQSVMRHLVNHPDRYRLRLVPVPSRLDREDVRLTLNVEEDWEHAQSIYEALGPEGLEWQRIVELLEQHPAITSRMAVLNRADNVSEPV